MEMATGQASADQLDTADFDNPVTIGHRHAGGFGIQYNRSVGHQCSALNGHACKSGDVNTLL
jgi:hypothetical protein